MEIEYPEDYNFHMVEGKQFSDLVQYQTPDILICPKTKRPRRRNAVQEMHMHNEIKKSNLKVEKQDNYFQKMYKAASKRLHSNLFLQKIRQSIVRSSSIHHELLQDHEESDNNKSVTCQWNYYFEVIFTSLIICQWFVACIISSLGLVFPQIANQLPIIIASIVTVSVGCMEIGFNFTSRSSLDILDIKTRDFFLTEVAQKYLKGWFFIDFLIVVIFFWDVFGSYGPTTYLKFIIIVKMGPTIEKIRNLQIIFIKNCFKEQYWELVKVFFSNYLFAHFLAIILILMTEGTNNNWLEKKGIQQAVWYVKYVWSYYWGTTIMLTIGFGDLTPTNTTQVILVVFIETFSCIFLAYNINQVGTIIKKIKCYQEQKVSNLKIFTQMEAKENVSEEIRSKIKNYVIRSSELKQKYNVMQEERFLSELPATFYKQFKQESTVKIFSHIPFFRNLPISKLQEISIHIQKKLSHPEQILICQNTVPDLLIANSGKIALCQHRLGTNSHGKIIQEFKVDQKSYKILSLYFFTNKPLNYDIICKDYTIVYSLKTESLKEILANHPYSLELYCMNRDKDRYNLNDFQSTPCQICTEHKAMHTLFDCPKLHFVPLKSVVVAQALKNNPDKVRKILKKKVFKKRPERKLFHSLKLYSILQQSHSQQQLFHLAHAALHSISNSSFQDGSVTNNIRSMKSIKNCQTSKFKDSDLERINLKTIYTKMGERVEEEIRRMNLSPQFSEQDAFKQWMESDLAHNFSYYFKKNNPENISSLFKKKTTARRVGGVTFASFNSFASFR